VFILDKIENPPVTGQRKMVIELAKSLSKLDREVYLYSDICNSKVEGVKIAKLKDLIYLPLKEEPLFLEYHIPSRISVAFWAKLVGSTSFLYSFMGGDLVYIFSKRSKISLKVFEKMVDQIIVISEFQKPIIKKFVDVDIVVIPPFMDESLVGKKTSIRENDQIKILFMGIPSYEKGINVLLDAYSILIQEYPDSRLVIADSGEYPNASIEFRKLIGNLPFKNHIDFIGVVNALEMLLSVDLFVYPARTIKDTMAIPLSILEALSVGTPAVSTDIGGVSEAIPSSYIARPGDHLSLYSAMSRALKTGDAPPLPQKFLKENVLSMYLKLYEDLAR